MHIHPVLIALAIIIPLVIWGAIVGPGGGEHRIDETRWDPEDCD